MKILMDADSLIKLAVSTAKEAYLASVEGFTAPATALEATLPGSPWRPADAILIQENIANGRIRIAGGDRRRKEGVPRPGEDGDADIIDWSSSPAFEAVVTDDRKLSRLLAGRTRVVVSLCGSVPLLVGRGDLPLNKGTAILGKLKGQVRESDRLAALRELEATR